MRSLPVDESRHRRRKHTRADILQQGSDPIRSYPNGIPFLGNNALRTTPRASDQLSPNRSLRKPALFTSLVNSAR